jgi:hypothetical protein
MESDSMKPWGNFSLSNEEDVDIDVEAVEVKTTVSRGRFCVVGKLIADHIVSKETINTKLRRGWKLPDTLTFTVLGENLFIIEFDKESDKARVLKGRPWVFEGNLFLVEDFDGRTALANFTFDKAFFWVRMSNLPLACMGREVGQKIGATVGLVEEVDTDNDGVGWGEFLRVKIQIDLTKPLPRGRKLKYEGELTWITFKYERLPKFCFHCGVISHGEEGCLKRSDLRNQKNTAEFGPWLRASSPTRRGEKSNGWYGEMTSKGFSDHSETDDQPRHYERGRGQAGQGNTWRGGYYGDDLKENMGRSSGGRSSRQGGNARKEIPYETRQSHDKRQPHDFRPIIAAKKERQVTEVSKGNQLKSKEKIPESSNSNDHGKIFSKRDNLIGEESAVEKERFSFGKVPVSIGKMSCDTKGHLKVKLHIYTRK